MRLRPIGVIYRKELVETLRDRRALFVMLALPILLYPLLMLALGSVLESHLVELSQGVVRVAVWGAPRPVMVEALDRDERAGIDILNVPAPDGLERPCEAARRVLLAGEVDVIVLVDVPAVCEPTQAAVGPAPGARGPLGSFTVLFDGARDLSHAGAARVQDALSRMAQQQLREQLRQAGLDPALAEPFAVASTNVAGQKRMGGHFAGRIIPLFLVLMVILGAFYPAIDLTAGEKERGTLETLVSAPVRPSEIVTAKYLTVVTIALIAATVNLASMGFTVGRMAAGLGPELGGTFSLSVGSVATVFALLIPTTMFFSAAMLAIATLARDFKEAQSLLTPAYMACVLPAAVASLPGVELDWVTTFAPAVNITLMVKDVLGGEATAEAVFGVMLANTLYTVLALVAVTRLFQSEQVQFGTSRPWRAAGGMRRQLRRLRRRLREPVVAGRLPTPATALVFFATTLVLLYYVASALQARDVISGLLYTEWGLLLVPALLVGLLGRFDLRETFHLRGMTAGGWLGSLLVAASAWTLAVAAVALMEHVLPMPKQFIEAMREFFQVSTQQLDTPAMLFVIALSPAVCEEIAFRGVLLAGLRSRLGRWSTIIVVGLCFGAFHLSVFRFVPTAVVGMVITFAVWQTRSILSAVLIHGATNALVFLGSRYATLGTVLGLRADEVADWPRVAIIAALLLPGLWLLWRQRPGPQTPAPVG